MGRGRLHIGRARRPRVYRVLQESIITYIFGNLKLAAGYQTKVIIVGNDGQGSLRSALPLPIGANVCNFSRCGHSESWERQAERGQGKRPECQ